MRAKTTRAETIRHQESWRNYIVRVFLYHEGTVRWTDCLLWLVCASAGFSSASSALCLKGRWRVTQMAFNGSAGGDAGGGGDAGAAVGKEWEKQQQQQGKGQQQQQGKRQQEKQ